MSASLNEYEHQLAIMESEMIDALNAFFSARPRFERTSGTMNCSERLFEAAFQRGWDARSNDLRIRDFPVVSNKVDNSLR